MRALIALLAAAAVLGSTAAARAEPPDQTVKDAARRIAQEGLNLYDNGKYKEALELFLRVEVILHAPTMLVLAARSLDKLGRLVEAADKYADAIKTPLDAGASESFRQAVRDAEKERAALLPRIPSIVVTVDAPSGVEPSLKLDGAALTAASLGAKKLVDPGAHSIEASAGGARASSQVDLKEGESRPVHLDLVVKSPPLRTVGWVALGLGAAGLAAWGVTGGVLIAKKSEIDGHGCKDFKCSPAVADKYRSELVSFNTLLTASIASLATGAVLVAGGAGLLLFGPKPAAPAAARLQLSPWIGFGSAGLKGEF